MSLLNDLRSKNEIINKVIQDTKISDYNKMLLTCPPISERLLQYLEKMFSRRYIKPNDPCMQQELVFQAGIDKVIQHLRSQNERQEKEIKT